MFGRGATLDLNSLDWVEALPEIDLVPEMISELVIMKTLKNVQSLVFTEIRLLDNTLRPEITPTVPSF